MSLIPLMVAGLMLAALVALGLALPHPVTWMMAAVMALLFFLVLLPQYQGAQRARAQGQTVQATVQEVRHWQQKYGDGNYRDKYEIIARWRNPQTGETVRFVSPPLLADPQPHLPPSINVTVDMQNPKNHVMDLSFLPE